MHYKNNFIHGHDIWLKQSKQFFDQTIPLMTSFFDHCNENESLSVLDEMIDQFKLQLKTQENFFAFMPEINKEFQQASPKYFVFLLQMLDETIELLKIKMHDKLKSKEAPQTLRDFYELWLECGDKVYQRWIYKGEFLHAFSEMVNKFFDETAQRS